MEQLIADALAFAKDVFAQDSGGHDFSHTLRVWRTACALAEAEGAEIPTVALAALLHDVDDPKLSPGTAAHKDRAVGFLRSRGVPEEEIARITAIIDEVAFVGEDSVVPSTLEGKCVQDADRLDAIGAVGIGRAFAYGGAHGRAMYDPDVPPRLHMTREEYRASRSTTLNHFYEKLLLLPAMMSTDTARALAQERDAFLRAFLDEFLAEWDGTR